MKRKNILCLCMIVLLVSGLVGCGKESRDYNAGNTPVQEPEETEDSDSQSGSGDTKEAESAADIQNSPEQENAEEGSESVAEGSNILIAYFSIPEDVEFLSAEMDGKTAVVNVSRGYYRLENVREVVCRSSIVWTLTSLEGVEDVKILVDGQPLHKKSGEEYGLMNRQNILIDSVIFAEPTEYAILKLFLQNPGQAIAKSVILDRISADTPDCTESSLKIHVSNLRKKLRDATGQDHIESVWGIGFKLNP